jgi:hypothetical protein
LEINMLADTQTLDKIFKETSKLSPEYQLRLVQRMMQRLYAYTTLPSPNPLQFGEFSGEETDMATFEDFAIAEWHPTDEELDGA